MLLKYFIRFSWTILLGCQSQNSLIQNTMEGKPLPEFSVLLSDHKNNFNTKQIPKGNPFVFIYFSPTCPNCRIMLSDIKKNIKELSSIQFYMLSSERYPTINEFNEKYSFTKYSNFTIGFDNKNFFIDSFKVKGIPFLAVYGKNKILKKVFQGRISIDQLKMAAFESSN